MLCERENYKYLELLTNFLLLTHGLTAYKLKESFIGLWFQPMM